MKTSGKVLHLDDSRFEIKLTPNRGDALSVVGVARDLARGHRCSPYDPRDARGGIHLQLHRTRSH